MEKMDHRSVTHDHHVCVEKVQRFTEHDLDDLCDAADLAIRDGGGFGWLRPPEKPSMERFWQGVVASPTRDLYVARLDDVICGTVQLVFPLKHNQAQICIAQVTASFVAPWARGYGVGKALLQHIEEEARKDGIEVLQLDVRETQVAAMGLFEALGFERWGTSPNYAKVDGKWIAGHYYSKRITAEESSTAG